MDSTEKNIFIFFENVFQKKCCYSMLEHSNGDDLIDEIIEAIQNWVRENDFKDVYDKDFQITRFNINDMIKIRIDGKYEMSLFKLKSNEYLKTNLPHEVEIVKLTDAKIFIGHNCHFQKGEKSFSSYNYLIDSAEFHIIARWDGTPPKSSAISSKEKNTTKFIMVDVLEDLLNKEFYNSQLIQQLNKIRDKDGNIYTYPELAERNNLFPSILTVECGSSFRTTINLVLYDKYKSAHEFCSDNIGFLKKAKKDNIYAYQIDKLFSKDCEIKTIEENIICLKETRQLCLNYLEQKVLKDSENSLIEKLDILSDIIITNDIRQSVANKLDQINQKLTMELKRKKLFEKFFNINQLYLCKVQNFQIPCSNFSGNRGNYIKPRALEMMPLGFLSFNNDMD